MDRITICTRYRGKSFFRLNAFFSRKKFIFVDKGDVRLKVIHSHKSDAELLAAYCQSQDPVCFSDLYERYMPLIYGVALKYLKNSADAQDAVMSLFEDLSRKVLKHEIRVFKSWLYTCVRNYCFAELQKRSGEMRVTLDENGMESWDDFNLDRVREEEEKEKMVRKCMDALPEKQRIGIYRFFIENRSYKEIEETTGFSLKLVKSLIQNGKRNLKICLEKKGVSL